MNGNTHEGWQAQADARCAPTARRMAAVELLIAQGYTWQDGTWAPPAKPEAVRLRDELRERLDGLARCPLCDSSDARSYYDEIRHVGYVRCGGDFPSKNCPLRVDISISPTNDSPAKAKAAAERAWNSAAAALAATGKQQVGEAVPETFDDGGDYYADQFGDGAWATYLRNGKGWVYNFGHGDDAEIRAKSVARELNRQVAAITARMQVGEVQGVVPYSVARDLLADAYNAGRNGIGFSEQVMRLDDALAARQPVGQEPAKAFRIIYPNGSHSHSWTDGAGPWPLTEGSLGLRFEYLYSAPTAQAVDLGQFREAVEHWHRALSSDYAGGHIDDDGVAMAEADRLLALIDGQA